ncbi:MAG: 30S ribosomal protein S17, partial [SAR202 cluster bacterium]|nr:30S ribosomal protein S17 [SAR202 cluster bacterium]
MRKVRVGAVVRTNQDKTAIVEMVWKQRHRLYRKQMRRVARFYVHDPENQCRLGDTVRIEETRRISKNKHWRLMEILERKQIAEVRPIDLETDVAPEMTQPRILAAEARAEATAAEASEEPESEVVEEEASEEPEAEEKTPEDEAAEDEPAADEPQEDEAEDDESS